MAGDESREVPPGSEITKGPEMTLEKANAIDQGYIQGILHERSRQSKKSAQNPGGLPNLDHKAKRETENDGSAPESPVKKEPIFTTLDGAKIYDIFSLIKKIGSPATFEFRANQILHTPNSGEALRAMRAAAENDDDFGAAYEALPDNLKTWMRNAIGKYESAYFEGTITDTEKSGLFKVDDPDAAKKRGE